MRLFPRTVAGVRSRRDRHVAATKQRIRAYYENSPMARHWYGSYLAVHDPLDSMGASDSPDLWSRESHLTLTDMTEMEHRTRHALGGNFSTSGRRYLEIAPSNSPQISGSEVDYVGFSEKEIRTEHSPSGRVFEGDIEYWEHPEKATYDAVVFRHLTPFIADKKAFARKLSELVKPGGTLIATETPWTLLTRNVDRPPHFSIIGRRRFSRLLRNNGFEIIDITKGKSGMYWLHAKKRALLIK